MRSHLSAALVAVMMSAVGAVHESGPKPPGSSAADPVTTSVLLTSAGTLDPIASFVADDLQVRSDGTLVTTPSWNRAALPVAVVVFVDVSWSATHARQSTDAAVEAAIDAGLVRYLTAADDIRVGTFGGERRLSAPFPGGSTAWPADARAAFEVPVESRYGPSPIWDAVEAGVHALEGETRRRCIVLFTDGQGTGNWTTRTDALRDAAQADVAVSFVPSPLATTGALLSDAAETTGGEYPFEPGTRGPVPLVPGTHQWLISDSVPLLSRIVNGLHATIRLSFSPPIRDGLYHSLAIESLVRGEVVHARHMYRAPASTAR